MRTLYVLAFATALLPILGEFSPGIATLQLLLLPASLSLLVVIVIKGLRRPALLFAVAPVVLGLILSTRLTMGVPRSVKSRAQVLITAVEGWKAEHGRFPPSSLEDEFPSELLPALRESGCAFYRPEGDSYSITCPGVAFTKCTYQAARKHWYGWD